MWDVGIMDRKWKSDIPLEPRKQSFLDLTLLSTVTQVLHILDILSDEKQGTSTLGSLGAMSLLNSFKASSGEPIDLVDKIMDKILSHPVEVLYL